PALEGCCIAGRLDIDYRTSLPQRLDALGFDLGGLAACELILECVARRASSIRSLQVGGNRFDQRVPPPGQFVPPHPRASAPPRWVAGRVRAPPATTTPSRRTSVSSWVKLSSSGRHHHHS